MRTAFFKSLLDLADSDNRVSLVVGDLGFGVVEEFANKFPDNFVNAGVAEQTMTGVAAGMALSGKIVYTYSIANFPTLRCLEQIRNDICYHNTNVNIVSVGGGMAYGSLGFSHFATEDIAIMRALPNIIVLAPGDPVEAYWATKAAALHPGPTYLRLGRAGERNIHLKQKSFILGKAATVRHGDDLTIISTGGMLDVAVDVADNLSEFAIRADVLSMHTIKPLDTDAILKAASKTNLIVTLEEHSVIGGLGGAVAEVLSSNVGVDCPLKIIGIPSGFPTEIGSQDYLRDFYKLSSDSVSKEILDLI